MPTRIQQRRTKGWRKPESAVAVGRGTMWGNPWKVGVHGTRQEVVTYYGEWIVGIRPGPPGWPVNPARLRAALSQLHGRDLMCWCRSEDLCHGDLLLKLANDSP